MSDNGHAHRFEIEPAYTRDEKGKLNYQDFSMGTCTIDGCGETREFQNAVSSTFRRRKGKKHKMKLSGVNDVLFALRENQYRDE